MDSIKKYLSPQDADKLMENYLYGSDFGHEQRVKKHALRLASFLREKVEFTEDSLDLLEYAAIFHDIGHNIAEKRHDLHTRSLIGQDAGFDCLPPALRSTLALIAGGHRKTIGSELDNHSPKEQQLICRLTAILRIADAIDYTRQCDIEVVFLEVQKCRYILSLSGSDLTYISTRIDKKKTMFVEQFGPLKVKDNQ
jgi:exopolyphosphatase / guanosine-5'-triphosphate,3'-diphosphate pyrophosphatase